jgi:hypothetical protein
MRSNLTATWLTLSLLSTGCAVEPRLVSIPASPVREHVTTIVLHGKPLELHLSMPQGSAKGNALILYASGDGGWFGSAVDMFQHIGRAGYHAVGFSSRAFLKIDRPKGSLVKPGQLISEYRQIVDKARTELALGADAPVVLTGWSRGASFAVMAAAEWRSSWPIQGVIAIGLSDGEDFEVNGAGDETDDGRPSAAPGHWPFQPYVQLAQLGPLRCAVIQSTGDQYLTAAHARTLFGSDTPSRRLYTIEARNHRFSGGEGDFQRGLLDAIGWVTTQQR